MSDDIIPIGEFIPRCPQCGANLLIEWDGVEAKPDDAVLCPVHKAVGTREDAHRWVLEQQHDEIRDKALGHMREQLGRLGIKPK